MRRTDTSDAPLGWGGKRTALPQERERVVRCTECGAIADCQTYYVGGKRRIGEIGLPVMAQHGKRLVHRGCKKGRLEFFDQPLRRTHRA